MPAKKAYFFLLLLSALALVFCAFTLRTYSNSYNVSVPQFQLDSPYLIVCITMIFFLLLLTGDNFAQIYCSCRRMLVEIKKDLFRNLSFVIV